MVLYVAGVAANYIQYTHIIVKKTTAATAATKLIETV